MDDLIITAAITGAETSKTQNPALPVTIEEQVKATIECQKAGATVVHLHVRDENQSPSQDLALFKKLKSEIEKNCDIIIQFSTGGAVGTPISERLAPLQLKPEMASLNVGSINFGDEVFENLPKDIESLAQEMIKNKIKPEIEVYDVGMLEYGIRFIDKHPSLSPAHFQFVFGTHSGISATTENYGFMRSKLPLNATHAVAGVGRHQLPMSSLAIITGGHVRVGFEDNIYWTKGVLAKSNAQLVERTVALAKIHNRKIASTETARKILNIK
ncbi:MAG: 3-keto-5-aminohexanoate cleavage protein [Oligoflexia bacterium]|nr:3-keto-5-aminohexanoate cleavage protein [Oligoflexia bacterium]